MYVCAFIINCPLLLSQMTLSWERNMTLLCLSPEINKKFDHCREVVTKIYIVFYCILRSRNNEIKIAHTGWIFQKFYQKLNGCVPWYSFPWWQERNLRQWDDTVELTSSSLYSCLSASFFQIHSLATSSNILNTMPCWYSSFPLLNHGRCMWRKWYRRRCRACGKRK